MPDLTHTGLGGSGGRDLRKAFNAIVRNWGHDVLLQRRLVRVRSGLYDMAPDDGFSEKLERYTVRHIYPRQSELMHATGTFYEGVLRTVDYIFFFPDYANPKEGDRILEPDERFAYKIGDRKFPGFSTYIVELAYPARGAGGRIEYWMAGVTRERPR